MYEKYRCFRHEFASISLFRRQILHVYDFWVRVTPNFWFFLGVLLKILKIFGFFRRRVAAAGGPLRGRVARSDWPAAARQRGKIEKFQNFEQNPKKIKNLGGTPNQKSKNAKFLVAKEATGSYPNH